MSTLGTFEANSSAGASQRESRRTKPFFVLWWLWWHDEPDAGDDSNASRLPLSFCDPTTPADAPRPKSVCDPRHQRFP